MTKLNLWDALKPTLNIQKLYCLSPFQIVGNQLKPSLILSIYSCVSLLSYYALMVYSVYLIIEVGNVLPFFQKSYLWAVIGGFEIIFNNIAFIVLMILSEFTKHQQLSFLNRIYDIDLVITSVFRSEIKYHRLRYKNIIAVILCFVYYEGLSSFVLYFLYEYGITSFGLYIFAFLYQYEQICSGMMSLTYINYVLLIKERFGILRNIQIQLANEPSNRSKFNMSRISKLFLIYKDLCSMVESVNENYGFILIIRIAHDFTLTTSQVYLISWILMDSTVTHKPLLVVCIFFWMIQNIFKICLTTLSAAVTIEEMRSFDLWLLHRKIEFNANKFFKIDMTLLYSIVGALASYTLILIQFKQQEESLVAESSKESSLNVTTMFK